MPSASISTELRHAKAADIVVELRDLYSFGRTTVRQERERQTGKKEAAEFRDEGPDDTEMTDMWWTRSRKYLDRLSGRVENVAHERALGIYRTKREDFVAEDLDALRESMSMFDDTAKLEARVLVSEAISIGRDAEARERAEEIRAAIYSALLDERTCDECYNWDGNEFQVGSPDYNALTPPNSNCASVNSGANKCRCIWVYVFESESRARG